jgi:lysophospholipase L1-like esterase
MDGRTGIGWALAALIAALLGGCGGSPPGRARDAAAGGAITIDDPVDGQALRVKQQDVGTLRRKTRVRGRAPAGSTVLLKAGCRPRPCSARATAGDDGRWSTTMNLTVARSAGFVSIDAKAGVGRSPTQGAAVATVELIGAKQAPRAKRKSVASAKRQARNGSAASNTAAPARRTLPRDVLVIGDSLAVGTAEALPAALPGWRVRTDAKIGRPLAEGMRILGAEGDAPAVLAFSLFTNDDPRNTAALEAAVRSTATRQGGCAVWSTVVRPPLNGVSYEAANSLLRRLANDPELALGLRLVDWSAEVAQSPSLIAGDGVHATPEGYRLRAQMFAQAILACAE